MFLAHDKFEKTAWYIATDNGRIEVLNKLRDWAKEVLTQEKLIYIFLDKDKFERTAWHIATENGQIEVLELTNYRSALNCT
jgi:ankyrin repeat protein